MGSRYLGRTGVLEAEESAARILNEFKSRDISRALYIDFKNFSSPRVAMTQALQPGPGPFGQEHEAEFEPATCLHQI